MFSNHNADRWRILCGALHPTQSLCGVSHVSSIHVMLHARDFNALSSSQFIMLSLVQFSGAGFNKLGDTSASIYVHILCYADFVMPECAALA